MSYFLKAQVLFQFLYLKAYKTVQKKILTDSGIVIPP